MAQGIGPLAKFALRASVTMKKKGKKGKQKPGLLVSLVRLGWAATLWPVRRARARRAQRVQQDQQDRSAYREAQRFQAEQRSAYRAAQAQFNQQTAWQRAQFQHMLDWQRSNSVSPAELARWLTAMLASRNGSALEVPQLIAGLSSRGVSVDTTRAALNLAHQQGWVKRSGKGKVAASAKTVRSRGVPTQERRQG